MPESTASCTTYWIDGISMMGKSSFGTALVAGRKRVPKPATGMTAFLSFMQKLRSLLDESPRFFFLNLLVRLAVDAERRHGTRFETFDADIVSTFLANPVLALVKASQRLLNLEDEFTFTIANTQHGIPV